MHLMGENDFLVGASDKPDASQGQTKSGASAVDWAVAIPASISNMVQSYAALKQKTPKVTVQPPDRNIPDQFEMSERSGLSTLAWVGIGLGAIAVVGVASYLIFNKRKGR